jgi:hypothetical protein
MLVGKSNASLGSWEQIAEVVISIKVDNVKNLVFMVKTLLTMNVLFIVAYIRGT